MRTARFAALFVSFVLACLSGCSYQYLVIGADDPEDLSNAIMKLNQQIDRAEGVGCKVSDIALGVGHGVGVGISIGSDCEDCNDDNMTRTVETATLTAAALLRCPVDAQF